MSFRYEELTQSEARDMLRQWRENNERRSEDVMELWEIVFADDFSKFGNEKHIVLEQMFYAALDCHNYNRAEIAMYRLLREFPLSLRAEILKVTFLEAKENYEEALEYLDNIITLNETNASARKRRVAILKAQGLISEAIKELVDYLKKFMSDVEGWQELSELYLQVQDYSRAAFCGEELILHQPHNHLMHQRLADIRYTMGGVENMELAKVYYSHALKLNPDNMRALLGLFLVTNNLLNHYKSSGNSGKRKEIWKLSQWVQAQASRKSRAPSPLVVNTPANTPHLAQVMLNLAITE